MRNLTCIMPPGVTKLNVTERISEFGENEKLLRILTPSHPFQLVRNFRMAKSVFAGCPNRRIGWKETSDLIVLLLYNNNTFFF